MLVVYHNIYQNDQQMLQRTTDVWFAVRSTIRLAGHLLVLRTATGRSAPKRFIGANHAKFSCALAQEQITALRHIIRKYSFGDDYVSG